MRRYGGTPGDWLDLSTGINPWAWPWPAPQPVLPASVWTNLPDAGAEAALRDEARRTYRVPPGFEAVAAPGTQALIGLLPQIGIALVLLVGGRLVIDDKLNIGELTAFYTYLVMLAGPLRMLGVANVAHL